jgi:tetratricopeptide (TPR) repeat protein
MLDLSKVLANVNQLDEAERLAREATAIQSRVFKSPNADRIQGMTAMARVLARRGGFAAAESAQREALAFARQLHGDSSGNAAMLIADLAGYVQRGGRLDEAAALHAEAIARFRILVGDRHATTAIAVTNLAFTEFLRKRYQESERLYRLGIPVLDSVWAGTPRIAGTLVDYGVVLSADGKCNEAEAPLRRGLEMASANQPATAVDVVRPKRALGLCMAELGRLAEAETLLVATHSSLMEGYGPKNPYTVATARDLVKLYERMDRPADAARFRAP